MVPAPSLRFVPLAAMAAMALLGVPGGSAAAQEATPPPAQVSASAPADRFPVALHFGTCAQPTAQPTNNVGDVQPLRTDNTPIAPDQYQGSLTAPPVLATGTARIEAKLDDLLAKGQPRVLLVHKSQQDYATYVACGELGGPVQNDTLIVALRPLNSSGYAGLAFLRRDGGATSADVYLYAQVEGFSGAPQAPTPTPPPSPTPGATPLPAPSPSPAPTATPAPAPAPTATTVVAVTTTPPPSTVVAVTATPAP